jgi:hypothetical protein
MKRTDSEGQYYFDWLTSGICIISTVKQMKKMKLKFGTALFALAMFSFSPAIAQTLVVSDLDDLVYGEPSESFIQAQAVITNSGSTPMNVMVRFEEVSAGPTNSGHYFCWAICYSEGAVTDGFVTPSQHALTIDAGASTNNFYSDFVPNGTVGIATYRYTFYDQTNPSDETSLEITFDTQNVGIKDVLTSGKSGISESYPNPAASDVNINYSLTPGWNQANLAIYSMLGSQVQSVNLNENQGTLNLDVSSLPAGLYFYTLVVDGNAINTKKMLVTK